MNQTTAPLLTPRQTRQGTTIGPVRPQWPAAICLDSWIRWLAYDRGFRGCTFATYDEHRHPGYDRAYLAGQRAARRMQGGAL